MPKIVRFDQVGGPEIFKGPRVIFDPIVGRFWRSSPRSLHPVGLFFSTVRSRCNPHLFRC